MVGPTQTCTIQSETAVLWKDNIFTQFLNTCPRNIAVYKLVAAADYELTFESLDYNLVLPLLAV